MSDHRSRPVKAARVTGVSAGRTHLDQLRGGKHGLTPEQVASSQRERVQAAMRALAMLDPLFAPHDGADERDEDGARTARARSVTAGSVGSLAEVLHREIAAGRVQELPAMRAQLTDTLTLPFTGGGRRGGGGGGGEADVALTADDAGERAFLAAYGEIAADVLGDVSAAMALEDDAAGRIRAGVAALLDFCADRPDRARALFVEALSAGAAARERRSETTRRLSDLFAQPLGELRPNERIADISAIALVGGFHELAHDAIDRLAPANLPTVDTIIAVARL